MRAASVLSSFTAAAQRRLSPSGSVSAPGSADAARDGVVVLLEGPLGAGKTVLAKGVARALGITDPVISPTYTIISEYSAGAMRLYHVDLYRIEGREQMENLGLEDILRGNGVVLVEWGRRSSRAWWEPTSR